MKFMQVYQKLSSRLRSRREAKRKSEADQRLKILVGPYLQHFDVQKVSLKKSPTGGWLCTFEDMDPTDTDDKDEALVVLQAANPSCRSISACSNRSLTSEEEDF